MEECWRRESGVWFPADHSLSWTWRQGLEVVFLQTQSSTSPRSQGAASLLCIQLEIENGNEWWCGGEGGVPGHTSKVGSNLVVNIATVRNHPDIIISNSLFGPCLSVFLSFYPKTSPQPKRHRPSLLFTSLTISTFITR